MATSLTQPTFVGSLNGHPLRFFKAPLAGPHLLWHSVDDLHRCMNLPRGLRRHYKQCLQRDYPGQTKTVATSDGITAIAPHWMAQGAIDAMADVGFTSHGIRTLYAVEATKAWNAVVGDLPPGENVALMVQAFRNTNGLEGTS